MRIYKLIAKHQFFFCKNSLNHYHKKSMGSSEENFKLSRKKKRVKLLAAEIEGELVLAYQPCNLATRYVNGPFFS